MAITTNYNTKQTTIKPTAIEPVLSELEYYLKHEHCPECFRQRDAMWIENPYQIINTVDDIDDNKCECECGWRGNVGQLISKNDFTKISKNDLFNFYKETTIGNKGRYSERTIEIFKFLELM
jgi:hypothetical protein